MKGSSFVSFDWNRWWQRSRSTSEGRDCEPRSVFLYLSRLYIKEKTDFGEARLLLICASVWDCKNSTGRARSRAWNRRYEFQQDYWKVWLSEHWDCQVCWKAASLPLKCDFDLINVIYLTWQVTFLVIPSLWRFCSQCTALNMLHFLHACTDYTQALIPGFTKLHWQLFWKRLIHFFKLLA